MYLDSGVGDHILAGRRHAHRGNVFEADVSAPLRLAGAALLDLFGRGGAGGTVDGPEEFSGGVKDEDGREAIVRHHHSVLLIHGDVDRLPVSKEREGVK